MSNSAGASYKINVTRSFCSWVLRPERVMWLWSLTSCVPQAMGSPELTPAEGAAAVAELVTCASTFSGLWGLNIWCAWWSDVNYLVRLLVVFDGRVVQWPWGSQFWKQWIRLKKEEGLRQGFWPNSLSCILDAGKEVLLACHVGNWVGIYIYIAFCFSGLKRKARKELL